MSHSDCCPRYRVRACRLKSGGYGMMSCSRSHSHLLIIKSQFHVLLCCQCFLNINGCLRVQTTSCAFSSARVCAISALRFWLSSHPSFSSICQGHTTGRPSESVHGFISNYFFMTTFGSTCIFKHQVYKQRTSSI